jgi:hypothetical protein
MASVQMIRSRRTRHAYESKVSGWHGNGFIGWRAVRVGIIGRRK